MVHVVPIGQAAPEPGALALAAAALKRGGLLIYPTDTLYALGCRALDGAAAARVRAAKGRDAGKPLPLVIAGFEQLEEVCARRSDALGALAARFWPGPLSLVVPAAAGLPDAVTAAAGTVAVRVPAFDWTRSLCRLAGPLVSTSANRSGHPAPVTCGAAIAEVGAFAELAVDGGAGRALPSTLVDLTGAEARLLRAGALPWEDVSAVLTRDAS
jgi:L-threonylcarbamoyladenylate synthase